MERWGDTDLRVTADLPGLTGLFDRLRWDGYDLGNPLPSPPWPTWGNAKELQILARGHPAQHMMGPAFEIVNKANVSNRARWRTGSKEWKRVQGFEQELARKAAMALADYRIKWGQPWPADQPARAYVALMFGAQQQAYSRNGKLRFRLIKAETRCRAYGVDSIKSVLDALQVGTPAEIHGRGRVVPAGCFARDEQVYAVTSVKGWLDDCLGDAVLVRLTIG